MSARMKLWLCNLALLAPATWLFWNRFTVFSQPGTLARTMAGMRAILDGSAPTPYRYRPLVAFVFVHGQQALWSLGLPPLRAHEAIASFLLAFGSAGLVTGLRAWLDCWIEDGALAALGTSIALVLFLGLSPNLQANPWHLVEDSLTCWGLVAIRRGRVGIAIALLVLAALTRETAVFFALGAAVLTCRRGWWPVAMLAVWGVCYGLLRLCVGPGADYNTLAQRMMENRAHAGHWLGLWALFLAPVLAMGVYRLAQTHRRGEWHQARTALALAAVGGCYLCALLLFTFWAEIRIALWIWLAPVALSGWSRRALLAEREQRATSARPRPISLA